jgi:hypothetical protein
MHRSRSPLFALALLALLASLVACEVPASRGTRVAVVGPYALGRTYAAPPVVTEPATQDARIGGVLRESRRMCDLRGGKGSC